MLPNLTRNLAYPVANQLVAQVRPRREILTPTRNPATLMWAVSGWERLYPAEDLLQDWLEDFKILTRVDYDEQFSFR